MGKSTLLTYLLWLFGGFFGLHHFYLGRDRQAFVCWCLLGGFAGAGWLRDLFWIPTYVADANDDPKYLEELTRKMRKNDKPPFSLYRFSSQLVFGSLLGFVMMLAIPEEKVLGISWAWLTCFIPLMCSIGVHTVGNIGREQGSMKWTLLGAYTTLPFYFSGVNVMFWTVLIAAVIFNFKEKQWRRQPRERTSVVKRGFILFLCGSLYMAGWTSFFFFNCTVTYSDGEKIKFREAMQNFFNSPMWLDFKKNINMLFEFAKHHGWGEIWRILLETLDPLGEKNALKILDLPSGVSQEQITSKWRKLSREWHPDKFQDAEKKLEAQERFMEIQQAYETLSDIKNRRKKQNRAFQE